MVPSSDTFAAVDAILPGQRLANVTINTKHEILLYAKHQKEGLVKVAGELGLDQPIQPIEFFWVLPQDRYDLATKAGPFPVSLGDADGSSTGSDSADGTASPAAGPKKRGRRPKAADDPVLAEYKKRIQQFALLVNFDPLPGAGPTPPS